MYPLSGSMPSFAQQSPTAPVQHSNTWMSLPGGIIGGIIGSLFPGPGTMIGSSAGSAAGGDLGDIVGGNGPGMNADLQRQYGQVTMPFNLPGGNPAGPLAGNNPFNPFAGLMGHQGLLMGQQAPILGGNNPFLSGLLGNR